jgi:hypothetical protein
MLTLIYGLNGNSFLKPKTGTLMNFRAGENRQKIQL